MIHKAEDKDLLPAVLLTRGCGSNTKQIERNLLG